MSETPPPKSVPITELVKQGGFVGVLVALHLAFVQPQLSEIRGDLGGLHALETNLELVRSQVVGNRDSLERYQADRWTRRDQQAFEQTLEVRFGALDGGLSRIRAALEGASPAELLSRLEQLSKQLEAADRKVGR